MRASVVEVVGVLVTTSTGLGSSAAPGIQAVTVFSFKCLEAEAGFARLGQAHGTQQDVDLSLYPSLALAKSPHHRSQQSQSGFHELITIHASSQQGYPEKRAAGQRKLMQAEYRRLQQTRHVRTGQLLREVCRIIALEAGTEMCALAPCT